MKLLKFLSILRTGLGALRFVLMNGHTRPLSVYMILTERCPNKCVYCNCDKLHLQEKGELSTSGVTDLISHLHKCGMRKLHLSGGEPLVRSDIGRIIKYAKSKGIFVGISLSGIFIPERIDDIKDADIVMLSLDGPQEIHDSLRGELSFERVMAAIDSLKKNNIRFWITTVLNKKTLKCIDYVLDIAEQYKSSANFVIQQHHNRDCKSNIPDKQKIEDLIPSAKELKEAIKHIIRKKRGGARVGSTYSYLKYVLEWKDYDTLMSPRVHRNVKCHAGRLYFHIDPRGMAYACGLSFGITSGADTSHDIKSALAKAGKMSECNSCLAACNIENNLLFSMRPESVINWLCRL